MSIEAPIGTCLSLECPEFTPIAINSERGRLQAESTERQCKAMHGCILLRGEVESYEVAQFDKDIEAMREVDYRMDAEGKI